MRNGNTKKRGRQDDLCRFERRNKITDIGEILKIPPYSLKKGNKEELLNDYLAALTKKHYANCPEYHRMLDGFCFDIHNIKSYYDLPFLPVRLFKEMDLKSIPKQDIVKTLTSSGTTGQAVSKIYLDKETAANQEKALIKIVSDFIGTKRMPMLILDTSAILKDRDRFSARAAGILGFSMFGLKRIYAFDEEMKLDICGVSEFLEQNKEKNILLFGFTFIIWKHFYKELLRTGYKPELSKGILIHGGGWKKLISESVSSDDFKKRLNDACGITSVHDYYGMVEQTGSIYMECEFGHLHTPVYSDMITRRHLDFSPCNMGEKGIIEVVSVLPSSYPGHALLAEDEGIILGEDDCPCKRLGKYFRVERRLQNAEIRGCSDTYAG